MKYQDKNDNGDVYNFRVDPPMKYKTKPRFVEAIQWTGKNLDQFSHFLGDCLGPIERRMDYKPKIKGKNDERHFWVEVDTGDYVYKDELGFHVTKERWFFESYEESR